MLVTTNSNPKNSIYFFGYLLLDFIKTTKQFSYKDIEELYEVFENKTATKIEFSKFLLLIDWFYMNNSIKVKENGEIVFNVFN